MANRVVDSPAVTPVLYDVRRNVGGFHGVSLHILQGVFGQQFVDDCLKTYSRVDAVTQEILYDDYMKVFDASKTFVLPSDPLTLIAQQIVRDSVDGIQDLAVYSWDEVLRPSESGGIVKASSTGYYYGVHRRDFSGLRPRKNNQSVLYDLKKISPRFNN